MNDLTTGKRVLLAAFYLLAIAGFGVCSYLWTETNAGSLWRLFAIAIATQSGWPMFTVGVGGAVGMHCRRPWLGILTGALVGLLPLVALLVFLESVQ